MKDSGPEEFSAERVRRMKELMRTFYKEEVEPKQSSMFKPIRAKGLISTISILALVIFLISTLFSFNRFIRLEEMVYSNKGQIQTALQSRANLFNNLVSITLNHAALEQEVFKHVADVRKDLNQTNNLLKQLGDNPEILNKLAEQLSTEAGKKGMASLLTGGGGGEASFGRLLAVVEQYPNLKTSAVYQKLMDSLISMETKITARREEYNESVRMYNNIISSFPWYMLAKITGFSRHDYFDAEGEKQMVGHIVPADFKRLVPTGEGLK